MGRKGQRVAERDGLGRRIGSRLVRLVGGLGLLIRWALMLWGRDLAKGRAIPAGFTNGTVRGKQTAQTANGLRLRREDP